MSFLGGTLAYVYGLYNAAVASLAAMTTDRNTWQTRANNAWGASRVWNSSTSFETAYNNEVTLYNSMTTDRDTWQGRANNAWGASRVWNSGASFESRLPHAFWEWGGTISGTVVNNSPTLNQLPLSNPGGAGNGNPVYGDGTYLYAEKAGYYVVTLLYVVGPNGGGGGIQTVITIAGATTLNETFGASNPNNEKHGGTWSGLLAAGDRIGIQATSTRNASAGLVSSLVKVTFVPTPTNPN